MDERMEQSIQRGRKIGEKIGNKGCSAEAE